jgi:hypothetical protein
MNSPMTIRVQVLVGVGIIAGELQDVLLRFIEANTARK